LGTGNFNEVTAKIYTDHALLTVVEGVSENSKAISIVDRYLEHGRIYIFHNGGNEKIYMASADWMKRNLTRRIEVAFPVYDESIRKEIKTLIDITLRDNTKARKFNIRQTNPYIKGTALNKMRTQVAIYNYFKSIYNK